MKWETLQGMTPNKTSYQHSLQFTTVVYSQFEKVIYKTLQIIKITSHIQPRTQDLSLGSRIL